MKITCDGCGAIVSSEVPDGTVLDAFVECPQCIEERAPCGETWLTSTGYLDHCARVGEHVTHRGAFAEWLAYK